MRRFLCALIALLLVWPMSVAADEDDWQGRRHMIFTMEDGMVSWRSFPWIDGYDIAVMWGGDGILFMADVSPLVDLANILDGQVIPDGESLMLHVLGWSYNQSGFQAGDFFLFRIDGKGIAVAADDLHRVTMSVRFPGRYVPGDTTTDWWVAAVIENGRAFTDRHGFQFLFPTSHAFSIYDESDEIHRPIRDMLGGRWYSIRYVAQTLGYHVEWLEDEFAIELTK